MISLEDVRSSAMVAFKSVHEPNYPTMLVNYPNFVVVDLERQKDPFVSVEIMFDRTPRASLGARDILVEGTLNVYYYFREGHGLSGAYSYTDILNEYLGMSLIDGLQYRAVQTLNVQTFPGWRGVMNSITFDAGQGSEGC